MISYFVIIKYYFNLYLIQYLHCYRNYINDYNYMYFFIS